MSAAASPVSRSEYFQQSIPFIELLGLKRESAVAGRSRLTLELRPELRNMYDAFHGGVIMTMLDVAMAGAAVSSRNHEYNVITVAMSTSFLRPGVGTLVAQGRAVPQGASLCACEAEIVDAEGQVVAKAIGTFKFRKLMHAGEGN
ncbi:MAG: PaaI family thioesterase [Pseudomonadota bacterium]